MRLPLTKSSRPLLVAAALAATVSLAIGANAALNKRAMDAASAVSTGQGATVKKASRLALVIGNGHYPDAGDPLVQPINDARALTHALRHDGFDVDVIEDASRGDMNRAAQPRRHEPRGRAPEGQDHRRLRGDAVLWRLWRAGWPRDLHDPARRHDLE